MDRLGSIVSNSDYAPTFLEATGIPVPKDMTGRSLIRVLTSQKRGRVEKQRDRAFFGRERHDPFRLENGKPVGYSARAVRTAESLYIRNFHPRALPCGR